MLLHSSFTGVGRVALGAAAVKPKTRRSRDVSLSKLFFGSTFRWTVTSCCSRSKGFQHAWTAGDRHDVQKLNHHNHDQIPPLSTVLQHLLPPVGLSSYPEEADSILINLASTWCLKKESIKLLDAYKAASIAVCVYCYPRTTSAERLAAVSFVFWIIFVLDDICFDVCNARLAVVAEELGIDIANRHDRYRMRSFWVRLRELFMSTSLPSESVPVEKAVWDAGRLMRSVSPSSSWFNRFVESVEKFASASLEIEFRGAGPELRTDEELEAYVDLRVKNSGLDSFCFAVEMVTEKYMSDAARNHSQIRRLTYLCSRYCALQNDLCSYHKEMFVDKVPAAGNLIQVMMDTRSISFQEAVQRVMDIIIADSREFLEIERRPEVAELASADEGLRGYIVGLKDVMSGAYAYHTKSCSRYHTVDNPFPELRTFN